mmetsp:Transcript_15403/g.17761  ORF Transcript_15403/g.17761 Transcript_15403/m.17761 type:complete len:325 (+) Transcript_15403:48-1022(+)
MISNVPELVVIHPLVLLSVVDHYKRVVAKNKNRRVVGVLLGEKSKGTLNITNSYAVPFEEDPKESRIWFLDHNYHDAMYEMFRKINAKEKVVGWYSTGTKFKAHDIEINELFKKYCSLPTLVLIDVEHAEELGLPTTAYYSKEEVTRDGTIVKNFTHLPSSVEALEIEEVAVEQLLRDVKNVSIGNVAALVDQKTKSLRGLMSKMATIQKYLENVIDKQLEPNYQIIFNLQEIFNCLPNTTSEDFAKALLTKNNDHNFVLYISSIIRSIVALHNLINNKLQNKEAEKLNAEKSENKDEKKDEKTEKKDEKKDEKKEEKGKEEKK